MRRFFSLRYRLLALVLVPLILLSSTVILLAVRWSSHYTYEQLFAKVNADLQVADELFRDMQIDARRELSAVAGSAMLDKALTSHSSSALIDLLEQQRVHRGFDFLRLWSGDGEQILTSEGWQSGTIRRGPLLSRLRQQLVDSLAPSGVAGIELYTREQWSSIPGLVPERVMIPLIPTERAVPTERIEEERALLIRTLQSVSLDGMQTDFLLEGGVLLNRNFDFVDEIRDLVYGPGSLAPGSRGTVTIFLADVRISTNVPGENESRALGTRVSSQVLETVLTQGERWVNRAFVVNDWYVSAYTPILDVNAQRVGMLYAGYLDAPFRQELRTAIALVSALVIAGSLLASLAAIAGARSIFTPIESMAAVVRATAAGERRRIGHISQGSEIGELASQFDAMLDSLESNRQRIEQDAAMLEEKVRDRTIELEMQNRRLQDSIDLLHQTRRQLANAEKLAALGELTAGVAHEINNPTAVILGNMDVLVADLGDDSDKVQTEVDLIIEQVYRIRSIIDRLLQYSRLNQSNSEVLSDAQDASAQSSLKPVSLPSIVAESLTLLTHELNGQRITVLTNHHGTLSALIGRQELQQVLVNLLSNAIQAIGSHGDIQIETQDISRDMLAIVIQDSGCGIDPVELPRIFDPFFTSGKARGTGLGLSVSYGIIRRFGGDIQANSVVGAGSVFKVLLPATNVVNSDEGSDSRKLVRL